MRKYLLMLCLAAMAVVCTSCQEDDETLYDRLVGRTWVGNLGFANGPSQLESGIKLNSNGFGFDEQYYYDGDRRRFGTFDFRWYIEYGDLVLEYGSYGPGRGPTIELRSIYVSRGTLSGTLYVEGRDLGSVQLQLD